MTQTLVSILEELTLRQDLKFLTLLTWRGVLSKRKLLRQYRAWCPHCYQQCRDENRPIYEPLLWSFRDAKICLHHQVALVEECPHCATRLPAIANFSAPGFCSRCRQWLGEQKDDSQLTGSELLKENEHLCHRLGELIALTPNLERQVITEDLTKRLQIVAWSIQRAMAKDLKRLLTMAEIKQQLDIATGRNQNRPYPLVRLVIPACDVVAISLSELLTTDYLRFSQHLSDYFQLGHCFERSSI